MVAGGRAAGRRPLALLPFRGVVVEAISPRPGARQVDYIHARAAVGVYFYSYNQRAGILIALLPRSRSGHTVEFGKAQVTGCQMRHDSVTEPMRMRSAAEESLRTRVVHYVAEKRGEDCDATSHVL